MSINNNAKNEFLKVYRVFKETYLIETPTIELDFSYDWRGDRKSINFNISNQQAISNTVVHNVEAGIDPNALVIESEVGVLDKEGSSSDYVVEKIEDAIFGNVEGSRGYNDYPFIATETSNYSDYISAGINVIEVDGSNVGGGSTLDKSQIYSVLDDKMKVDVESYRLFIAKIDNGVGNQYVLVRPKEYFEGNKLTTNSDKYRIVYDLYDFTQEDMEFVADSTISIDRIVGRLVEE